MNQVSPNRTFTPKLGQRDSYTTVAILFHWTIAACIVVQLALGFHMADLEGIGRSLLLQIHKTVGILVLLLTAGRLAWRFTNPPPPPHDSLTPIERLASHWVHIGFYAALFVLPLTGWAMVSAQRPGGMKILGGVLNWPGFPGMSLLPGAAQDVASDVLDTSHAYLAWVMLALMGLHIAGALKHHFISKDPTLTRMAPGTTPGSFTDKRLLAIPAVAALIAAVIYLPKLPVHFDRPKPKDVASADIYADIVGPSLERRCGFCHSEDVSKGGLSLATYEAVMQGGRSGPAVVPGHPEKSELIHRVILPSDNPKYMPKDGKPPMGKSELAAIKWWIAQGAPRSAKVGSLKLTPEANSAIKILLGGDDDSDQSSGGGVVLPSAPPADKAAMDKLIGEGFILRKADTRSNLLVADYILTKPTTAEAIADLAKLAPQLYSVNLRKAGVTDAEVKTLAGFPKLSILRLEENAVTDAAAKDIAGAKSLTYLNLTNTKITDAGFSAVAALPKLEKLYIWGTAVTPAAIDKAKADHKGMLVFAGLTEKDVKVETKTMTPSN